MKHVRRVLFWAIGLGLLGYLIYRAGIDSVWQHVQLIGWGYVPVMAIAMGWHMTNTWAWAVCFEKESRPHFWALFCAKISGEAIGNVTPTATVGGELAKVYMLKDRMSVMRGVPSLVINKTIEMVSGLIFALVGAGVAIWQFSLPVEIQLGLGVVLLVGAVLIVVALVSQRQNMFVGLIDLLGRLHLPFLESRRAAFEEIDRDIAAFYRQNKSGFWWCMNLHMISWIFGILEVYVVLLLLHQPATFATSFLLTSLSLIINSVFFFIPSGVGVFESGHVFLFHLLGLGQELGLGVGIIRRIRKIFWVIFGFILMATRRRNEQPKQ